MLTRLIRYWDRGQEFDRRQLLLFPDAQRGRWLTPLPSAGAAFGLTLLFAVTMPSEVGDRTAPLSESRSETESAAPVYDVAAIPDHIKAASERYRLSEDLIKAVITVESGWDPDAVSRKGARGLMQLMPKTSAMIGVRDPHNPPENIDAGASHLRAMLDTFKNDLPLALAAYNAGEQTVVRYRGVPPYPETRRFVSRVLRKVGDQQGAERVMAKPVPPPQWISRRPRPPAKIQTVTVSATTPTVRPTMVAAPAPRSDSARASAVMRESELREASPPAAPSPLPPVPSPTGEAAAPPAQSP